jgi:hypothetical protein
MKYVDNLLECRPEEIQVEDDPATIAAIVSAPDAVDEFNRVVIVWSEGRSAACSVDGKQHAGDSQNFIYRSKNVQRLKPLHVILAEHPYQYDRMRLWIGVKDNEGITNFKDYRADVLWENRGMQVNNFAEGMYPDSFFDEVEE